MMKSESVILRKLITRVRIKGSCMSLEGFLEAMSQNKYPIYKNKDNEVFET